MSWAINILTFNYVSVWFEYTSVQFVSSGGTKDVDYEVYGGTLTLVSKPSWLNVTIYSSYISITVSENTSTDSRSGDIHFAVGGNDYYISVMQVGISGSVLTVNPSSLDYSWEGGSQVITLESSSDWNVKFISDPARITVSPSSQDAGTYSVIISLTQNDSTLILLESVVFENSDGVEEGVSIAQDKNPIG